jgi:DNA repair exonuclease SbcCD ATPase subunit
MQIPYIPEISGYSEMVDLLANVPLLQERLKKLHELETLVNNSLGDLNEVQKLKAQKHEITTRLAEAQEAKQLALDQAKIIMDQATADVQKIQSNIDREAAKYHAKLKEVQEKEIELSHRRADVERLGAETSAKEKDLNRLLAEATMREKVAGNLIHDFTVRKQKVLEIFE